jgi:hypothetical protein
MLIKRMMETVITKVGRTLECVKKCGRSSRLGRLMRRADYSSSKRCEARYANERGEVESSLRVFRFNGAPESATSSKFTGDDGPDGPAGLDDVLQHTIHGIFVKNAKIPVRMNIQLQRF